MADETMAEMMMTAEGGGINDEQMIMMGMSNGINHEYMNNHEKQMSRRQSFKVHDQ